MLLFHYVLTRGQSAAKVLLNMIVLPVLLAGFWYIGKDRAGFDEIFDISIYALVVIEIILGVYLVWLLLNPSRFEIRLSEDSFSIQHPFFPEWCFSVDPADIESIENIMDRNGYTTIAMKMRNGDHHQICPNYKFSREKLYRELSSINPDIRLPDNPYYFSKRPARAMRSDA